MPYEYSKKELKDMGIGALQKIAKGKIPGYTTYRLANKQELADKIFQHFDLESKKNQKSPVRTPSSGTPTVFVRKPAPILFPVIRKPESVPCDEDIKYLINSCSKLLLEIAAETTGKLTKKQEQLQQCKWTDGESNTDTEFSELACKCAEEAWLSVKQHYHPILDMITMTALIPDINCIFSKNGKIIKVPKNKIELKSSKNYVLPGSTIGKLDINQPLIYCYRPKNVDKPYEIRYGQYHTAMGESNIDLFQDRTPRPQLNFRKLFTSQMQIIYSNKKNDAWISHYGKCAVNRLNNIVSYSWQDSLTKSILYEALKKIETIDDLIKLRESVRPTLL